MKIPQLGFGTWQLLPGPQTVQAVSTALEVGYRHVDTARVYFNESSVGKAIRDSQIPREEIFVTTKLRRGETNVAKALDASLRRLKLDHVNLYLMHWPQETRLEAWRGMIDMQKAGLTKNIGVSNFTIRHLTELMDKTGVTPAINQVEFHPFLYQKELLDFCTKHNIKVEAYSPLAHGKKLADPRIVAIAAAHKKSPAQVMVGWALQHDLVVIPKSKSPERIKENFESTSFKLTADDMKVLDGLNEDLRTCWDPSDVS